MKVLFLLNRIPFPLNDGGAIAAYKYAEALHCNRVEIEIIAYNTQKHYTDPSVLQNISRSYSVVPLNTSIRLWNAFTNLWRELPYSIERFVSPDFINRVASVLQNHSFDFDVIHIDHTYLAWSIPFIREIAPQIPIVVRLHNVEYIIAQRLAAGERKMLKKWYYTLLAKRTKQYESKYYALADLLLPLTADDAHRVEQLGCSTPIQIVQGGVDTSVFIPNAERIENTILIFGSWDWQPNIEGLHYFCNNVYPILIQQQPTITIHLGGKNPTNEVYHIATTHGFTVHANVPSAAEFIAKYKVLLIPLLSGGGMRMKMIEAMACGTVVVSTPVGAEGIPVTSGEECYLAESPNQMVQNIISIFAAEKEFERLSKNSRTFALQYDWSDLIAVAIERYQDVIQRKKYSMIGE